MSTTNTASHDWRARRYLDAQRTAVLAIVDGLNPDLAHRQVVASGWSTDSLLRHLAGAERYWCQTVVAGVPASPAAGDTSGTNAYRTAIAQSDAILDHVRPEAVIAGRPFLEDAHVIDGTIDSVVHHLIEETARHAGHLDIARELLDGHTGLGPR